ncbi:hypothetical protein GWK48_09750 [Metallosphaera tengchongensis]|uniref:Nicotinamide riboside transporter PnuC n=1 Tax=Metallosphaera tengchongensis TaxID=1532350 RepID=A0A6N0NZ34_9CREN|nr:hypothetical protein [Metallosphaera tengchongensis]QKR00628.1 hypothetical protein GWK48_09750 [Metallosphaera tengchongensis]
MTPELIALGIMIFSLIISLWKAKVSFTSTAIASLFFIIYGLSAGEFKVFYLVSGSVWLLSSIFSAFHEQERWYSLTFSGTVLGIMVTLLSKNYLQFLTGWEVMTVFAYASIGYYKREWKPP